MVTPNRLTETKYKCTACHRLKQLVKVRGRAWLCTSCYRNMLSERRTKRKVIKEMNKIFGV